MALKQVGALWKPKNPESKAFASGQFTAPVDIKAGQDVRLVVFAVKTPRSDKSPQFEIALATDDVTVMTAGTPVTAAPVAGGAVIATTTGAIPSE